MSISQAQISTPKTDPSHLRIKDHSQTLLPEDGIGWQADSMLCKCAPNLKALSKAISIPGHQSPLSKVSRDLLAPCRPSHPKNCLPPMNHTAYRFSFFLSLSLSPSLPFKFTELKKAFIFKEVTLVLHIHFQGAIKKS